MNNQIYRSGNYWDTASPCSQPQYSEPLLPDYNGILTLKQDFIQAPPIIAATLNSTYPGDGITLASPTSGPDAFYLVDQSPTQDAGGYSLRWTYTWARVPDAHQKPGGVFYYSYPGIDSNDNRQVMTIPLGVASYIQRTFWLVGVGQTYTTYEALVAAQMQRGQIYYNDGYNPSNPLAPSTILSAPDIILDDTTTPSQSTYIGWCNARTLIIAHSSAI